MQSVKNIPFGITADALGIMRMRGMWCVQALLAVLLASFVLRGGYNEKRALEVLFLLVFAGAALTAGNGLRFAAGMSRPVLWLLAGFFLLGAASSVAAFVPRYAFYEVANAWLLLLLSLAVAEQIASDPAMRVFRVLQAIGFVCLLYALKLVVAYIAAVTLGPQPVPGDLTLGFENYRYFNHAQTITLPLLVLLCLLEPGRSRLRWLWFALAALWWAMLFVTSARGSLAGLIAACTVALVVRRAHAFAFLKTMLLAFLAGVALYVLLFILIPLGAGLRPFGELAQVVDRTISDPASGRLHLWGSATALVASHPWLGVGPLHFAHYASDLKWGAHPHNWMFQIAAEWGAPALLCLCGAIVVAVRRLLRSAAHIPRTDVRNQNLLVGWIVTGAALLVDGLFSGVIVMPQCQLLIALYLGCAAGWAQLFKPGDTVHQAPVDAATRAVGALLVLAAIGSVALGAWPELVDRLGNAPLTAELDAANRSNYTPRFWIPGYF